MEFGGSAHHSNQHHKILKYFSSAEISFKVIVKMLSCLARTANLYLVVDLAEVVPCDPSVETTCPEDGHYFFNTAVVFNRDGGVIAK